MRPTPKSGPNTSPKTTEFGPRLAERFQVDLSGMVDLLSRHLYSGPQVYLRELLQNAVDAVTARRELDAGAEAKIRISASTDTLGRAMLEISDSGIGLTSAEAAELLATIGRSSKRDEDFGLGRTQFIGQFGIGLLAAFMVADSIEVVSKSARGDAPAIRWIGHADGTFEVTELPDGKLAIGSTVRLLARSDAEHWLSHDSALTLALEYGSLLPFDVAVRVPIQGAEPIWRRITEPELPWKQEHATPSDRHRALADYCESTFGFTPLASIDLALPLLGVSGAAFVLPQAISPASGRHRIYTKRMLLGSRVDRVLPEWSFFVRAVLDTELLSPTASREQLHDDETLLATREALGEQIKLWALEHLRDGSPLARSVLETHHLAFRALALSDDDMLELVAEVLPFETTDGPLTLAAAAAASGNEIVYTTTTEAYRRVASVARAQGLVVVNAGYVYDADLMQRLATRRDWRARELKSADLVQVLGLLDLEREMQLAIAISAAKDLLADDDCDVIARKFSPSTVPAMLLRDSEGEHRRERDRERAAAPALWSGLLDSFAEQSPKRSRTLVLNDASEVTRMLLAAPDAEVFAAVLRSLYLNAVMLAGEGLRQKESAALQEALGSLLELALRKDQP